MNFPTHFRCFSSISSPLRFIHEGYIGIVFCFMAMRIKGSLQMMFMMMWSLCPCCSFPLEIRRDVFIKTKVTSFDSL